MHIRLYQWGRPPSYPIDTTLVETTIIFYLVFSHVLTHLFNTPSHIRAHLKFFNGISLQYRSNQHFLDVTSLALLYLTSVQIHLILSCPLK